MYTVRIALTQAEIDLAYDEDNDKIPADVVLGGVVFKVNGTWAETTMPRAEYLTFVACHHLDNRFCRVQGKSRSIQGRLHA